MDESSIILAAVLDDVALARKDYNMIRGVKNMLKDKFHVNLLGDPTLFIYLQFISTRGGTYIHQSYFLRNSEFSMKNNFNNKHNPFLQQPASPPCNTIKPFCLALNIASTS